MTPRELKNSILELALQGKLVEQRPEEGTAEELYCQIQEEKERLVKEGKIKKGKPLPEITEEEEPFEIPETWKWVGLGSVCTVARGGSPRPIKEYITTANDGVNWIKIGDTEKNGKYIISTAEKIKPAGVSKSRMVHSGDFLLTNSMSFGHPYILKIDGCIHDGWLVISQPAEIFDQDYLYWMLSSEYAYSQFCHKASGAVVKNLNIDKVANSVFPLPPLAEQRRIVAKLDELMPLVDRYKKAEDKLQNLDKEFPVNMQKSILQMAFEGRLVPQNDSEKQVGPSETISNLFGPANVNGPFDIPDSWRWSTLGGCCEMYTGNSISESEKKAKYQGREEGYDYIGTKDVSFNHDINYNNGIKIPFDNNFKIAYGNSVLMCIEGGSAGKKIAILDHDVCFGNKLCMFKTNAVINTYLYYWLQSTEFKKAFTVNMTGIIGGVSIKKLKSLPIPLPPLAEQRRIVAKLDELMPLVDRYKKAESAIDLKENVF